ncbi:MAG: N-acetylmuramoyl-L-alanine amidase [Clostridia bacterium]|nr:N-acetylmuramoyl-L-alanine amidase [Clostridia bacterium]
MGASTIYRKEPPIGNLLKFILFVLLFVLCAFGLRLLLLRVTHLLPALLSRDEAPAVADRDTDARPLVVVLDAGHGGEDGGTSASDGTKEKDLNLSVTKLLADLFRLNGAEVILTRDDDRLLYDPTSDYKGRKKMLDQRARLEIAQKAAADNENATVLFLSIHMNSFPSPTVEGLQVWYSSNTTASEKLASRIQSGVTKHLQPENSKGIKAAGDRIYLLDRLDFPAVLIECGFLSSPKEAELLKDPEYQKQLAFTIYTSVCEYVYGAPSP